jgi:hypothetical protein
LYKPETCTILLALVVVFVLRALVLRLMFLAGRIHIHH